MAWEKVKQTEIKPPRKGRRLVPCISRSASLPEIAYIMMPVEMAPHSRVSIYHDGGSGIALEFGKDGDFVVRQTSARSYTVRITIPKRLAHVVPIGIRQIALTDNGEGLYVVKL